MSHDTHMKQSCHKYFPEDSTSSQRTTSSQKKLISHELNLRRSTMRLDHRQPLCRRTSCKNTTARFSGQSLCCSPFPFRTPIPLRVPPAASALPTCLDRTRTCGVSKFLR
mmetsp:Transcript_12226/g.19364  ORF Transcript_12226/g.19364 Transcript_12226/m.19364 type:complete len:110 (-) Transcript_12226:1541-1870(-)